MIHKLAAIVVAGGASSRFKADPALIPTRNKQFVEWNSKPLFIHTLEAILNSLEIAEAILVINEALKPSFEDELGRACLLGRVKLAMGGERRQDSVRSGLELVGQCERVLVHDSARPFVSADFLKQLEMKSRDYDALIPVLPIVETVKELNASGQVVKTHNRSKLFRVQTPQFFATEVLKRAHERFENSRDEFTDDAAMIEALGCEVHTASGDPRNIKVTTVEDLKAVISPEAQRGMHAGADLTLENKAEKFQ